MTEDEAKTKWCPMVRYKSINGEGINRWDSFTDSLSRCIGSDCMMWEDHTPDPVILNQQGEPAAWPESTKPYKGYKAVPKKNNGHYVEWHRISNEKEGDCGLKSKEQGCFYPA